AVLEDVREQVEVLPHAGQASAGRRGCLCGRRSNGLRSAGAAGSTRRAGQPDDSPVLPLSWPVLPLSCPVLPLSCPVLPLSWPCPVLPLSCSESCSPLSCSVSCSCSLSPSS